MAKKYEITKVRVGRHRATIVQPQRAKASGELQPHLRIEGGELLGYVVETFGKFVAETPIGERQAKRATVPEALSDLGVSSPLFLRSNGLYDAEGTEIGRVRRRGAEWYAQVGDDESASNLASPQAALDHLLGLIVGKRSEAA